LKSRSLNLLEPSGPVQAYNGIALPLPFTINIIDDKKEIAKRRNKQITTEEKQI